MSQAKGSPAPSRLQTGSSTTTSSTSRPNTNATTPLLPPILEAHNYYITPAVSTSLISGSNSVAPVEESRPSGVRKTSSQINSRLGFFSSPDEPRSVGSHGYISASYAELRPAAPGPRLAAKPHGNTGSNVSGLRSLRNGTSLLTDKDLKFLRERDSDNQQVFDVWSQRKHLELQMERDEQERLKAASQARYEAREQQILEQNQTAVKQWTHKKVKQQQAEAEDSYLKQIKLRALQVYHQRMNHAYEAKCKKREDGFAVRSGVAHIPHTFDAFRSDSGQKAAHQPLGKEKSATSHKSLLEEADREGDEEAELIVTMGGTHPLVALARQKSGDVGSPDGGGNLSLEPSFASAARHGAHAASTLPPLNRHLVSPAVLAQYLPSPSQASKASESGGLALERSGMAGRHIAGSEGGGGRDDESSSGDDPPQALLPPNITSIYAPREVIGAIMQSERDQAQDEFQQRLKEAAEESMRKVEAAYMPPPPGSAVANGPTESGITEAASDDTSAMLHVSPAFFAAYGTSSGDGAAPARQRPPAAGPRSVVGGRSTILERNSNPSSGREQQESARNENAPPEDADDTYSERFSNRNSEVHGAYSRSGSGLAAFPSITQSGTAALTRGDSSSRNSSPAPSGAPAALFTVPSSGPAVNRRESTASKATSEIAILEPGSDMASDVVPSRRESLASRLSATSENPLQAGEDAVSDAGLSWRPSSASQPLSARGSARASTSGRRASRGESATDRGASEVFMPEAVEDGVLSSGPSRRESELSSAGASVEPSRRESTVSTTARGGAGGSRRESEASRSGNEMAASRSRESTSYGTASGGIPSRRESAASVVVSRRDSEQSKRGMNAVSSWRQSSSSGAAAGVIPTRRDSAVSNVASESSGPSAVARVASRQSSTSTAGPVRAASIASDGVALSERPSKRDLNDSVSVSGRDSPSYAATATVKTSRQASNASGYSVPLSDAVGGTASASGELADFKAVGRNSDGTVDAEPSLGFLPPVDVRGTDGEAKTPSAGKAEETSDEESESSEEGEETESESVDSEEQEEEEDEDQGNDRIEARDESEEEESEDEGNDVRSAAEASTEGETEGESEEEESEEDGDEEDEDVGSDEGRASRSSTYDRS